VLDSLAIECRAVRAGGLDRSLDGAVLAEASLTSEIRETRSKIQKFRADRSATLLAIG
jgi:hypothetical protein